METHKEILEQLKYAKPGKECRELHRKLRKYGDGLCFRDRYPNFPFAAAIIAMAVSLTVLIMKYLGI